jgi:predicted esterase
MAGPEAGAGRVREVHADLYLWPLPETLLCDRTFTWDQPIGTGGRESGTMHFIWNLPAAQAKPGARTGAAVRRVLPRLGALLAALAASLAPTWAPAPALAGPASPTNAGAATFLAPTYDSNGFFHLDSGASGYVGYKPDTYDDATPISLFAWMHGCGGEAEGDMWTIAPPGTRSSQSYIAVSIGGRDGGCWDVNSDTPKVLSAISDVGRYFNIDPRRVYVGGYSSGGDLAYRVGFEHAGMFAGILAENSDPFRDTGSTAIALMSAATWKINIGHVAHISDAVYPIATVRASFATLAANSFPATKRELPGTHFDGDSGTTGTNYDLIHSLLPFLDLGWTSPALPSGGRYIPVTPVRTLDTRDGTGGFAAPVGPGATIDVPMTGRGGVPPAGVSAVAVNVTVTQPSASGFLTIYPTGTARPLAANLNFTPAKTVPNLVVVKVGAGGKASLFNSAGNSHVVFDLAGWYTDGGAGNDGRYTALVPARILDTRSGVVLGPGASLDLQVSGMGGVPASGAEAAVMNVAVTDTTAASYLTVFPTGLPRPLAANLNFTAGDTVSNRVVTKLGTGGKVTIYNNAGTTDVVVDVGGWYSNPSVAGTAGGYTALDPSRLLDTRDATGGITGPIGAGTGVDVQISGRGGVPATGVSAVILNATVTEPAGGGYLTISPAGTPRPLASDLNYASSETRPNLVVVRLGTGGKVNLFTSAGSQVVFDVAGWFS